MYRRTAESKIVVQKTSGRRDGGFTLVEVMLTVAVLVVLMGLGMVGVARYQKSLKMVELDNAAREIYMAAQNRAVLLKNSGRLDSLLAGAVVVSAGPNGEYYISSADAAHADALSELLPWGSVDPTLREGNFCILYKPASGSVADVFYVEAGGSLPDADSIDAVRIPDRNARMDAMLGWYGCSVPDEVEEEIPLPAPGVEVSIENGNELILTVRYTLPSDLPTDSFGRFAGVCTPKVTLDYQGTPVDLQHVDGVGGLISVDGGRLTKTGDIASSVPGSTVTYRWLLDSVRCQKNNADGTVEMVGQQFKGLFAGRSADYFGGDFTVTAELTLSADGYISSYQKAQDTDNSLYDSTSTDTPSVACIANLRHLQNLDNVYSNAGGKDVARQIADIDAGKVKDNAGTVVNGDYEFQPIQNIHLHKYEASYPAGTTAVPYSISNLKVVPGTSSGDSARGLFRTVNAWAGYYFEFVNVRLVDSSITGSGHTGGLTAAAPYTRFTNCSVENVTVTQEGSGWGHVGGLAAYWWGDVEFYDCKTKNLAATNNSASRAGGLIASANSATDTITIQSCVVGGSESAETIAGGGQSGGLVGFMHGGSITGCKVINTKVGLDSGATAAAGGLVGQAGDVGNRAAGEKVTISGCWVYWTDTSRLGTSDNLKYQVRALYSAGGLIGELSIDSAVDESFAATLVYGGSYAGGLAGRLPGLTYTLKVTKSYTDCYIYGAMAGGLVGVKEGGTPRMELENSYTTGYISTPAENLSAGLCGGWSGGNINVKNVYAAIFYTDAGPHWPLAQEYDGNGYYLRYEGGYAALSDLLNLIVSWIINTGGDFGYKGAADCHPYNLDGKPRTSYQLLGLKDLPHYGDWPYFSF